jgi:hypothetical protein
MTGILSLLMMKRRRLAANVVFPTVLFFGLFAMTARDATDPDLWWHLASGQFIVEHRGVPHTDPFSYTRAGQPWIAHEWLTDILLYELHHAAGWAGLIAVFAFVLCGTFFLLYLRCGANAYVGGIAALCAAFATRPVWGVRPQVISLLFTSLWLLILERSEHKSELLWWTIPLTLLWVNLHAGFALGLALLALFLIGEWIEGRVAATHNKRRLQFMALIFVLDLLVVPLNPNGFRLFLYPLQTLDSKAMQSYIAEWASPNFHRPEYAIFLLIVLAGFALWGWSAFRVRLRDLTLLAVSLFAGLRSIRLMPLFVLIAVPLISRQIAMFLHRRPRIQRPRAQFPRLARFGLNTLVVLAMAILAAIQTLRVIRRQPEVEARYFPRHAVAFLRRFPPPGPIFNDYDWGGYLVWKLNSSLPVFVDGRADVYGEGLLHQFGDTYQFKDDWRATLQRWNVTTVLVPVNSPLAVGLRHAPGWNVSYVDDQAIVFTATTKFALPDASRQFAIREPIF